MLVWLQERLLNTGVGYELAYIIAIVICISLMLAVTYYSNTLARRLLSRFAHRFLTKFRSHWLPTVEKHGIVNHLAHIAPIVAMDIVIRFFSDIGTPESIIHLLEKIILTYLVVVLMNVSITLVNIFEEGYNRLATSHHHPIKSYTQIVKLLVYLLAGIFAIAIVLDKSPWALLTGIGAMTAIIILVFKDTLLGFIASIQLTTHDMVRLGDWITMPTYGADGEVIEIALNTVQVKNFDQTVVSIPTYALLSSGVKNWRAMRESGVRRIKQAIYINMETVKFCDEELLSKLATQDLITTTLNLKQYNATYTNVEILRDYIGKFFSSHPHISQESHALARLLKPNEFGLPLELYCYCTTTEWADYESIQSGIIEHVLAILPVFGLQPYQQPYGSIMPSDSPLNTFASL